MGEETRFVALEGIDGSGKATQTKLLRDHLDRAGFAVEMVSFPQYGKKSAGLVEEYLSGAYGTAVEVGPRRASIFYACDRYDASFRIRELLSQGHFVLADRYLANIGHQGGKIGDRRKRSMFFHWLHRLEYGLFGIPRPAVTFILQTSAELATELSGKVKDEEKRVQKAGFLGEERTQDIHEVDEDHERRALESYLQAAEEFPGQYAVVECLDKDREMLPPEVIHEMIWERVAMMFGITG